mmetsp:Transcript_45856/g.143877  ORF Transcript_45856/g.143877 Transcript_45856/m.143877 type:complete len:246 (+) Transcript_45856:2211-2948(+)
MIEVMLLHGHPPRPVQVPAAHAAHLLDALRLPHVVGAEALLPVVDVVLQHQVDGIRAPNRIQGLVHEEPSERPLSKRPAVGGDEAGACSRDQDRSPEVAEDVPLLHGNHEVVVEIDEGKHIERVQARELDVERHPASSVELIVLGGSNEVVGEVGEKLLVAQPPVAVCVENRQVTCPLCAVEVAEAEFGDFRCAEVLVGGDDDDQGDCKGIPEAPHAMAAAWRVLLDIPQRRGSVHGTDVRLCPP